ncbi:MAG TPA: thiamine pyrophosphate-dependent enzyme [Polyangiaceae bacterium]|nr:thiamine pyrophosphate-dependent enzyme [Polyangiaceae bacterium]
MVRPGLIPTWSCSEYQGRVEMRQRSWSTWVSTRCWPAGIGAALATGEPVVVIACAGGLQCNLQELRSVVRNKLPVRIVVIDNASLGMVRQFQESYPISDMEPFAQPIAMEST